MMLARLDRETLGYGQTAVLPGLSFALAPGERVVLLGRSGAGKSTLLAAIFDRLDPGRMSAQGAARTAQGASAQHDAARPQRVALVPQDHALVPQLSVLKNVLMGRLDDHGAFYNFTNLLRVRAADRAGVAEVLKDLDLSAHIDRPVQALSGGQKQRVALARAWWRGGNVLIADEPVSAVDETQARVLLDQARARFATSLLALHDVEQARAFATRLLGLQRGGIRFDAPPNEVSDAEIAALYAE